MLTKVDKNQERKKNILKLQYLQIQNIIQLKKFIKILTINMSQDHFNTDRVGEREGDGDIGQEVSRAPRPATERDLHYDSPSKYDIDFYQRKVSRLEHDLANLQEDLSLAKFRLQKAEDFEDKYDILFKQYQSMAQDFAIARDECVAKSREAADLTIRLDEASLIIKNLETNVETSKQNAEEIRRRKEEAESKVNNQGVEERQALEEHYLRQIETLKREAKDREEQLSRKLSESQQVISSKETAEDGLKFKLGRIKQEKDDEIKRLKESLSALRAQLLEASLKNDDKLVQNRSRLVQETDHRVALVRKLTLDIENTLLEEVRNLNETVTKKDAEISYLIECDRKQIQENEEIQRDLKAHIRRLQDKIFVIQRESELELFSTVSRLHKQYEENIASMNADFDRIRVGHKDQVKDLKTQIGALEEEVKAIERENRKLEDEHKRMTLEKELSIKMLSEKVLGMEKEKDDDFKNYTVSMRNIEEEAKSKLDDLHTAIASKNSESEILNAQLQLKNEEISYLLEEINKLRDSNREKMRKLESTNAAEQNALNDMITSYKREILELKRRNHEIESVFSDEIAQAKLRLDLALQDLSAQKQANATLHGRNEFLSGWCQELEGDLKRERMSNVDILHDQTAVRRETVQVREQVKVELEAAKEKEVEQIRNVFNLERSRLETDLAKKEQELAAIKSENGRLLVEYKNLERKVGKPSKLDRGAEEEGKCKATLQAEILLTENIFNAINQS